MESRYGDISLSLSPFVSFTSLSFFDTIWFVDIFRIHFGLFKNHSARFGIGIDRKSISSNGRDSSATLGVRAITYGVFMCGVERVLCNTRRRRSIKANADTLNAPCECFVYTIKIVNFMLIAL